MNGENAIFWISSVFMIPAIIALSMGKGAFLIAGYNTSSKEEKAKYDEKKLCRSLAVLLLFVEVCVAIQTYTPIDPIYTLMIMMPAIVICVCYANFKCKKKDDVK